MVSKVKELVVREMTTVASPQLASYFAYCESPMLKKGLREISTNINIGSTTVKREKTYGLQDIEARCMFWMI